MEETEQKEYFIEPGQECEVDLLRPEDAEGTARLFLSVYGKDYPVKTYIQPEALVRENEKGRIISAVARTPKGDIVGHCALFASAPYHGIRESGAGVVHASYRGGAGIFTRLCAHNIEVGAKRFGVEAAYGEPVCNHVFSQKMTHSLGCTSHALEVDLMPASAYETEKSATGRVAALLDFVMLQSKPHRVFIPPVYEEALAFFYSGLNDGREIMISAERAPADASTRMQVSYFDFAQVARIAVWECGKDFRTTFEFEEKKALDQGAVVLQVWLNLKFPWVHEAADVLMRKGYFLGGLLPRWFDSDGLLMQRIMSRPNWESIQLQFDRAKRIRDLVRQDWMRVSTSI